MSNGSKKLFLSAVSSEFVSYRELLSGDLKRPNLDVAVQEDFIVTGGSTLEKLDHYIRHCDGIVHLIGKASGALPEEPAVAALLVRYPEFGQRLPPLAELLRQAQPGFSYTQWEAYLGLYHRRPLFVYRPKDFESDALDVPRAARFVFDAAEAQSQQEHYERISALGQDRGLFLNEERLSTAVLRDLVEILPRLESTVAVAPTRLRHTAERLIGRDEELTRLDAAWNDPHQNVVIVRAFGGMGKTSLVAAWMAELALKDWRGAGRVFDWSFYSQGTREQGGASAETFFNAAFAWFGIVGEMPRDPWERGSRLAQLMEKERCLLVLDGLEPLQYPPGPMAGKLKDPGIESLLKGLTAHNEGLCVVTTREKVVDIQQHYGRTADDFELIRLTDFAGAALLHHSGARRAGAKEIAPDDKELQAASREAGGHGLTLQLLGQYLRLAEDGDILRRDTVHLSDADQEYQNDASRPYGHAFKAMEAYEKWFASAGEIGRRQLAILRLLGLFDRPASASCLDALRATPLISELTEPLGGLSPRDWNVALSRLEEINLLTVNRNASGALETLDAHPLLREYFARQLRTQQPDAWRATQGRLYEHLCAITKEGDEPTLEDLQPLYQAVAHGCQAGLQQEACDKVYHDRICRVSEKYVSRKLGAFGSNLGAVACFFERPWSHISPVLTKPAQAWLLGEASFSLRALGRLTEALEPMRTGLVMSVQQTNWKVAAVKASNLSELELTLGEVAGSVRDAEQAVTYSDRSDEGVWNRVSARIRLADAELAGGQCVKAKKAFTEIEAELIESNLRYRWLPGNWGFRHDDVRLAESERWTWRKMLGTHGDEDLSSYLSDARSVIERASQRMTADTRDGQPLVDIALDHLTLGRAALYAAILEGADFRLVTSDLSHIDAAVAGLRRAGQQFLLVQGLVTRAWCSFAEASFFAKATKDESAHTLGGDAQEGASLFFRAQEDLDEAWEIAERGPMKLFLADIHLYRARLFGIRNSEVGSANEAGQYPWESPAADLAAAEKLINECGYHRRDEELADAKAVLLAT
jgi:hypothetical protein